MKIQSAFTASFIIDGVLDTEDEYFQKQMASVELEINPPIKGLEYKANGELTTQGVKMFLEMTTNGLSVFFGWCEEKGFGPKEEMLKAFIKYLSDKTNGEYEVFH